MVKVSHRYPSRMGVLFRALLSAWWLTALIAITSCQKTEESSYNSQTKEQEIRSRGSLQLRVYKNPAGRLRRFSDLVSTSDFDWFSGHSKDRFELFLYHDLSSLDSRYWLAFNVTSSRNPERTAGFHFFLSPEAIISAQQGSGEVQFECSFGYSAWSDDCRVLTESSPSDNKKAGFLPSFFPSAPIRCLLFLKLSPLSAQFECLDELNQVLAAQGEFQE